MARPRTFDEAEALDRAMEVFWKKGYQGTSTDDLMEAMEIGRGSFYNTFGSKKDVYLRTLDRYIDQIGEVELYSTLFESEPGFDALRAMLESYLETLTSDTGPHGCYFVHVAKEHRGEDPEVQKAILNGIEQMQQVVAGHIEAAKARGVLPAGLDARRVGLLMHAVAWGSHVMMEAGMSKDDVVSGATMMFELCCQAEMTC